MHTSRGLNTTFHRKRSSLFTSITRCSEKDRAHSSPVTRVSTEVQQSNRPKRQSPQDIRQQLLSVIIEAGSRQIVDNIASASVVASGGIERLQRLWTPPPQGFPPGPSGDQTVALLANPLAYLTDITARYGNTVGLLLGGERVVVVTGNAHAQQVLIDDADTFIKEGTAFFPGSSLTGNGLLVSDGEVWKKQRRLANPAFRKTVIRQYAGAMVAATEGMMERTWKSGGERDLYADFNTLTLAITMEALFGLETSRSATRHTASAAHHHSKNAEQDTDTKSSSVDKDSNSDSSSNGSSSSSGSTGSSSSSESGAVSSTGNIKAPTDLAEDISLTADHSTTTPAHSILSPSERTSPAHTLPISDDSSVIVSSVALAFEYFGRRAGSGFAVPEWVPIPDNLLFIRAVEQLDKTVFGLISSRRQALQIAELSSTDGTQGPRGELGSNLLNSFLLAKDDDGVGMTDLALRDELMTLLIAGQETSAILLGWATGVLAHDPEAQAAAAKEVQEVLAGARPTAADVSRLPVLEAIVLEVLRLHPPAYMVGRCACRDITMGPYSLPKGTTVLVSPYIMHRDPSVWSNSEQFFPQRWQEHQSKAGYQGSMTLMNGLGPNGSYLPFGAGPRNCIGTGFALMETMLILASILQNYSLAPGGPSNSFPTAKPLLTLRPEAVLATLTPLKGVRLA